MDAESTTTAVPSLYALWNFAPAAPSYLAASIVTSSNLPTTTQGYSTFVPYVAGYDVDCPAPPHPQHDACSSLGIYPARIYEDLGSGDYSGVLTDRHASATTEWRCALTACGRPHGAQATNTAYGMCTGVEQASCALTITDAEKKVVTTTTLIEGCEAPKSRIPVTITAGVGNFGGSWEGGDPTEVEGVDGNIENWASILRDSTDDSLADKKCPDLGRPDLASIAASMSGAAGASPATGSNGMPAETGAPAKGGAGGKARLSVGLMGVVLMACGVLSI